MGLFGKMFDKKVCDICGGEIGMLGNRKLADGNLCKNCAQQLSPWMTDRKENTVQEIREHLDYRRENAQRLASVRVTRTFGHRTRIYLDDHQGVFFVTSAGNWQTQNPDLIALSQVMECSVDVRENRTEQYHRTPEGRNVSFNPPRYVYHYRFYVTIHVDSPYFNRIHFELTDLEPDSIYSEEYQRYQYEAEEIMQALQPRPVAAVQATQSAVQAAAAAGPDAWTCTCGATMTGKFCTNCGKPRPQAEPAQTQAGWTCTGCGQVNQGRFCINCGAAKPADAPLYRCDKCGWQPEDPKNPPKFCPQCGDPFGEEDIVS